MGLAALLATGLLAVGLRQAGVDVFQGFVVLLLPGCVMAVMGLAAAGTGEAWCGVERLVLKACTPFAILAYNDVPLFGRIAVGAAAETAADRSAAGFRLTDGLLRRDLSLGTAISKPGRRGPNQAAYFVVPVAGQGWTPDGPASAWAVHRVASAMPAAWSAPDGLVRPAREDDLQEVIPRAARCRRLHSVPVPVIGRWVPDPRVALAEERTGVATILGVAVLPWLMLMLTLTGRRERHFRSAS